MSQWVLYLRRDEHELLNDEHDSLSRVLKDVNVTRRVNFTCDIFF